MNHPRLSLVVLIFFGRRIHGCAWRCEISWRILCCGASGRRTESCRRVCGCCCVVDSYFATKHSRGYCACGFSLLKVSFVPWLRPSPTKTTSSESLVIGEKETITFSFGSLMTLQSEFLLIQFIGKISGRSHA